MSACKIVRIFHEPSREFGAPVLEINETDFDPEVHELYDDAKHGGAPVEKAPEAPKVTKDSLRAILTAKNIAAPASASLADLQKMVDATAAPAGFA